MIFRNRDSLALSTVCVWSAPLFLKFKVSPIPGPDRLWPAFPFVENRRDMGRGVLTWGVQSGSSTHKLYLGAALTSVGRKDLSQHETDLRLLHWGHHPEEEAGKGTPGGEGDQRGSLTSKWHDSAASGDSLGQGASKGSSTDLGSLYPGGLSFI